MSFLERLIVRDLNRVIAFLKEMQEESDLRFEPEDPFQTAIDDLRNALFCIEAIRNDANEVAAWRENIKEPQEVDVSDIEAMIAAARTQGRDSIRISARDLWRMASDRRGREEE